MKMSVREARAQFATALAAAERGERVTITKNGRPVAELGPPGKPDKPNARFDWAKLKQVRKEMGLDKIEHPPLDDKWLEEFNDPAWNRELLGLGDDWDPTRR